MGLSLASINSIFSGAARCNLFGEFRLPSRCLYNALWIQLTIYLFTKLRRKINPIVEIEIRIKIKFKIHIT